VVINNAGVLAEQLSRPNTFGEVSADDFNTTFQVGW
jgi:hypothetical protein